MHSVQLPNLCYRGAGTSKENGENDDKNFGLGELLSELTYFSELVFKSRAFQS